MMDGGVGMSGEKQSEGIAFNNIRINSLSSNSGVFAGQNFQCLWYTDSSEQSGFGTVAGNENTLEKPCSVVTDQESSSEFLEYFKELIYAKMGKWGI